MGRWRAPRPTWGRHPGSFAARTDLAAAILLAEGHSGPAIVVTGQDEIDLVPALGPCSWAQNCWLPGAGRPLHVAMAQAPDLRQGAGCLEEGVVGGDPAILVQAYRLAEVVVEGLGLLPLAEAITQGDEEVAILRQQQPRSEVSAPATLGC